jgi:RNA polymerase sigma factor (sigma-70 family)
LPRQEGPREDGRPAEQPDEVRLQHNPLVDLRELERLHTQCWSWALTCTRGQRGEAEDVLQMTYLAIIEGRARFDGASSLRTWLFGVIRNHARSRWRLMRRTLDTVTRLASLAPGTEPSTDDDSPEHGYAQAHSNQRVLSAFRTLPTRQREILDLVFYRDLSIAEAATVMGIALGTARLHYERAKTALRRLLGDFAIAEERAAARPEKIS